MIQKEYIYVLYLTVNKMQDGVTQNGKELKD